MESGKRTPFLTALCIITFIVSGTGFFGYFFLSLFFDKASEFIIYLGNTTSMDGVTPIYFLIFMVLHAVSIAGAIRIWKLHRDGFYIYLVVQLIIVSLPVFQFDLGAFSFANAIFIFIFIGGYAFNLKYLR